MRYHSDSGERADSFVRSLTQRAERRHCPAHGRYSTNVLKNLFSSHTVMPCETKEG